MIEHLIILQIFHSHIQNKVVTCCISVTARVVHYWKIFPCVISKVLNYLLCCWGVCGVWNKSPRTALDSFLYLFINGIFTHYRSGPWHLFVSTASMRPVQEQIVRVVITVTVTVPNCLCAVFPKIVGSSSILPGPFNVFLLAPGTHNHGSLATFLILKKGKADHYTCIRR